MLSSSSRTRFVLVSQQLLALGVVLACLTPAARTITMEVRPPSHGGDVQADAYLRSAERPSRVPAAPVDPKVTEYSLTAPAGARLAPGLLKATARRTPGGGQEVTSDTLPVSGYGAVGITWAHGVDLAEGTIEAQARYRTNGTWSGWTALEYHDDHGPDPDSEEARNARPGTDALIVGHVDDVQVRIDTEAAAPADMRLAVVDPGKATTTARQTPALDTGAMDGGDASAAVAPAADEGSDVDLAAAVVAPKPKIFSRAQWGADESMRDKPSLHYGDVHAGFIHHTVNANDYTRAQVPAIIRGIYAYHTQSRGWSDVGYNFLVDRFGRIWEGRYGGVDRAVVGAHTLGYNDDSFAMSAIGNYEVVRPSSAMVDAYARLFAWKLGLHGVGAGWKHTYVTSRYFEAINGHRDADSTACPGKYLYARIPDIRDMAVKDQGSWQGRDLESNLVGSARPDLVARRAEDGSVVLLPVQKQDGTYALGTPVDTGLHLPGARNILRVGDWDKDGVGDLVARNSDGGLDLYRGLGKGKFDTAQSIGTGFAHVQLLTAVGDMTGDGFPDLMGQPRGGDMRIYPGNGLRGLKVSYPATTNLSANRMIGVGRWDVDGAPDVFTRSGDTLQLRIGNGPGGLVGTKPVTLDVAGYDWLAGVSDVDLTGHADVLARLKSSGQMYLFPGRRTGFGDRIPLGRVGDQFNYIG